MSAEELEYVLNAVLEKSKCHSHRGQGLSGEEEWPHYQGSPRPCSLEPQTCSPWLTCMQTVETVLIADFPTADTMQASDRVFCRLFYRKASGKDKNHRTS